MSGRNPRTGETLKVVAAKIVKFTAGRTFKDSVNCKDARRVIGVLRNPMASGGLAVARRANHDCLCSSPLIITEVA